MRVLRIGDIGTDVEYLSLGLTRAGFSTGGIRGTFDENVHNSLVAFQNNAGISADGVAGEQTYANLLPYLKGYTTVVVGADETIETLSQRYSTSTDAIRIANPMLQSFLPGAEVVVPFGFDVVSDSVNYSYELVTWFMDGLNARYPFTELSSAGASVMEKELWYLKTGTGDTPVFFNASHHANEWITTPVLMKFLEDYLKAIAFNTPISNRNATDLYATKTLYVMPLVNPDGVDLVTGALPVSDPYYINARSIASSYPSIEFPNGWKANIAGTDLNLNYPASWEKAKEIKGELGFTGPAPRDFVGTSPLSAIESRALYNFTTKNNFALTVSLHTQGEVIYWKYLDYLPPRSEEIAKELSGVSGYALETTPYASGFAGYKDWYISYFNRPGYTVELGRGTNPLPISDFSKIYPANRSLLTEALYLA